MARRIRFEDLLRHFVGPMTEVVGAHSERKRGEREQAAELKREGNAEKLKMRLLERDHARDARADARADAADRRAEEAARRAADEAERRRKESGREAKNPWVYQGMRFATKAERDAAREEDVRTSARVSAENRAPRDPPASESPTSHSRTVTSARGDLERWYSRRPYLAPSAAEKYLRELYGSRLTGGEISNLVEDVRGQYDRSRSGARSGR